MRVHEAAKKYKIKSEEILTLLKKEGFTLKSHMSGLTDDMIAVVEKHVHGSKGAKAKSKAKPSAARTAKPAPATKTKAAAKAKRTEKTTPPKRPKTSAKPAGTKPGSKPATPHKPAGAKPGSKPAAPHKPAGAKPAGTKPGSKPATPHKPAAAKPKSGPARGDARRPQKPAGRERRPGRPGTPARRPGKVTDQQKAVRESVRRTLAKLETTRKTKRRKSKPRVEPVVDEGPIRVTVGSTITEFARALKLGTEEVLERCRGLDLSGDPSDTLDRDALQLLAEDLDREITVISAEDEDLIGFAAKIDPARLKPRPAVVTVMGHVDHGKTSILDYIRKSNVASREAGGITQHIGAYQVEAGGGVITFIDTPGHEAFTSMRARGARVTDIVVLVVAADDGVMPQTIEAINHAKAAEVPIIVAINKTDLPGARTDTIKQQLTEHDVVVESFGGDVLCAEVSAKTGQGIDKLLEMILLQAEVLELKADAEATPQAVAIEVKKEEGRGILCTVLVTQGTLKIGNAFIVGTQYGKIKAMFNHLGKGVREAGPSSPVLLLGSNGLPEAGDRLVVLPSEKEAREASVGRQQAQKEKEQRTTKRLTLDELYSQIQRGDLKELRLVVKGDTSGSVEALTESLTRLSNDEVAVKVLHAGVGLVAESDVLLAASSNAIIVGFGVKVTPRVHEVAERQKVEIREYEIIYEAITEIDDAMKGLLEPERVERTLGKAEVRKIFKISRLGQIAGSFVVEGSITRNASARVLRDDEVVYEGKISSLKRFQDDVREVQKDFECGIGISGFAGLQEGDVIEAFVVEEQARVS